MLHRHPAGVFAGNLEKLRRIAGAEGIAEVGVGVQRSGDRLRSGNPHQRGAGGRPVVDLGARRRHDHAEAREAGLPFVAGDDRLEPVHPVVGQRSGARLLGGGGLRDDLRVFVDLLAEIRRPFLVDAVLELLIKNQRVEKTHDGALEGRTLLGFHFVG